jgi:hypothetical protein
MLASHRMGKPSRQKSVKSQIHCAFSSFITGLSNGGGSPDFLFESIANRYLHISGLIAAAAHHRPVIAVTKR